MTRSLIVTTWFPDELHPSRTPFCLAHVHALQKVGVDVEVVHVQLGSSVTSREEVYEDVPVVRVAARITDPRSLLAAVRVIRRRLSRADVLHTMAFSSILVAVLPWLLRRRPWVHTEHWNGVSNPRSVGLWWLRLSFLRHILRLPHAVTGVTTQLANEMARFARAGATRVVPCVVDPLEHLAPFPPPEPLRLVGVGLLNERKNPLIAIDAVGWLAGQRVDIQYQWVGDGPLREVAEKHARKIGVADRVRFTGAVTPSAVARMLAEAHIFFVPSTQENFFTAAAEAIVAGRIVVLPRSGGFVEYCTPENSVLAEDWKPETLGRSILSARDRLTTSSPKSIAASLGPAFSKDAIGDRFLTIYAEICR